MGLEGSVKPVTTDISITIREAIVAAKSLLKRSETLKNQIFNKNKKKTVTPKILYQKTLIQNAIMSVNGGESSRQDSS